MTAAIGKTSEASFDATQELEQMSRSSTASKHFFHTGDQFNDMVDRPSCFETTDRPEN